jgi:hypothetical protein
MIVLDDFIKDKNLFNEIISNKNFFLESMGDDKQIAFKLNSYHKEDSPYYSPFMFWDGWWRSSTNTLKKKIIKKIWENNIDYPLEDILGFEYWTRTYSAGQFLDFHVDQDSFRYEKDKTFIGGVSGSVYYGIDNPNGGFLEIHKNTIKDGSKNSLERENILKYISPKDEMERIAYKGNRLIIFDSGHTIHNTTPATSGIRQVLVVNVWHKDNPPLALSNGSFYYE